MYGSLQTFLSSFNIVPRPLYPCTWSTTPVEFIHQTHGIFSIRRITISTSVCRDPWIRVDEVPIHKKCPPHPRIGGLHGSRATVLPFPDIVDCLDMLCLDLLFPHDYWLLEPCGRGPPLRMQSHYRILALDLTERPLSG